MRIQDIIRRPLVTEKSTLERERGAIYTFEVARDANKVEIKRAVEAQFGRKVASVRTANVQGKERRQGRFVGFRSNWKKAYVRLVAGEKPIEIFEGV